jgi:DNA-binding transcriptional regulator YdaS (Cro superfamily)
MDKWKRKELLGYGNQKRAAKRAGVSEQDMSNLMTGSTPRINAKRLERAKRVVAEMIHERHPAISPEEVWAETTQLDPLTSAAHAG